MASNAELVRSALDAFFSGNDAGLRDRLAADAQWLWHRPGDHDCHGREQVLDRLAARRRQRILTGVIDARDGADGRVLVRWFGERMQRRFGVPGGAASIVVTVDGDRIARIQDCTGHAQALALAGLADA